MITPDQEEHARLVLMDQEDRHVRSISDYAKAMRDEYGDAIRLGDLMDIWTKYRGSDRINATHSATTGQPRR